MNIFVWLFLAFSLSLLALLLVLALAIALDSRAARTGRAPQSRHASLFLGRAALGRWWAWRKYRPEQIQPEAQVKNSIGPREPTHETLAGAPLPAESIAEEPPGGTTAIGKLVTIKGQIFSCEGIYLDCQMEGTVEVPEHRLTIGPEGRLKASVRAREIVVHGTIHGKVEVGEKMEIRRDAEVVCDIKTGRIMIEDGAYLKGSIDMPTGSEPSPLASGTRDQDLYASASRQASSESRKP